MSEFVHPGNPFPVSDNFKAVSSALINAAVETFAFIATPLGGEVPAALIVNAAHHWAVRMTGAGAEDASHGLVWELSVHTARLMHDGVPFPPFDIVSSCGDDECEVDHAAQARVVNAFFDAARSGTHDAAVKVFVGHVRQYDHEEWADVRAEASAMLLAHISERVSEYRSNRVEELPSLD